MGEQERPASRSGGSAHTGGPANPAAFSDLRAIFADRCVTGDDKLLDAHSSDQVGDERCRQRPAAVVFPESTGEVASLMKWAARTGTPVTPRGAGSGLAGGAIPAAGGVVCSFARMNRILEIDTENLMVVVEPGVVTNALDAALEPHGLFFAGYPMSEDICFIGGNVAENAGPWQTHEDVVVPPARVGELADVVEDLRVRYGLTIPFFGHAGDGNFHLVPFQPESMPLPEWAPVISRVLDDLYERVAAMGGTISGEHGIGRKRAKYLSRFVDPAQMEVLRRIKHALDPQGILNPGVVLE